MLVARFGGTNVDIVGGDGVEMVKKMKVDVVGGDGAEMGSNLRGQGGGRECW